MSKFKTVEQVDQEIERLKGVKEELMGWPRQFSVYVHGDKQWANDAFRSFLEEVGWDEDDDRAKNLAYCVYEVKLTLKVNKDGSYRICAVDEIPLAQYTG